MSQRIEIELADDGSLVIPHSLQLQLGLVAGAMLVIEKETLEATYLRVYPAEPVVLNMDGLLVVQAAPVGDLIAVIQDEREKRLTALMQSVCP